MFNKIPTVAFFIFLLLQIFCKEILVDEIYFIVNNKIITKSDFEKEKNIQEKVLASSPANIQNNEQLKITDELIISNMVIFSIIENELFLKNFSVTADDVTNAIKQIMYKNNIPNIKTFKKVLEKQMPFEQFYTQQKKGLVMQKFMQLAMQNSQIKQATPGEVKNYYLNNKDKFRIKGKTYKVSEISLQIPSDAKFSARLKIEKKINQIKEEIESKKISFEKAVLKYTENQNSKISFGNIGWILRSNPKFLSLQKELQNFSIGEITKPISINNEVAIYKITAIKKSGYLDLKEVKDKIKILLQQQQQQQVFLKEIKKSIQSSYISKKTKSFPKLKF